MAFLVFAVSSGRKDIQLSFGVGQPQRIPKWAHVHRGYMVSVVMCYFEGMMVFLF